MPKVDTKGGSRARRISDRSHSGSSWLAAQQVHPYPPSPGRTAIRSGKPGSRSRRSTRWIWASATAYSMLNMPFDEYILRHGPAQSSATMRENLEEEQCPTLSVSARPGAAVRALSPQPRIAASGNSAVAIPDCVLTGGRVVLPRSVLDGG